LLRIEGVRVARRGRAGGGEAVEGPGFDEQRVGVGIAETSRIIASSSTPNISIISGVAIRANSTAVAPRRERTNRRMTVRS